MSESPTAGARWPEQDAVLAWLEARQMNVPVPEVNVLCEAVTAPRLAMSRSNQVEFEKIKAQRDAAEKKFIEIRAENDDLLEEVKQLGQQAALRESMHAHKVDSLRTKLGDGRKVIWGEFGIIVVLIVLLLVSYAH